ncbi:hypothetical protein GCM10007421_16790 [Halopseudomonas oceani]|nr:hypothetical protein GCM10007421_16790 [Halopseudomonas oceani]
MRIAGERDLTKVNLLIKLILQAVGVNKDAIVLLLQELHLQRHLAPVSAELLVAGLEHGLAVVGVQQSESDEVP